MFVKLTLDEFEPIIKLFEEDNGGEVKAWIDMGRLFVRGDENEIMIRFNVLAKKITIARIQFTHQRRGYGTRLLNILKEYGLKNQYAYIELESLMTPEILAFAKKHGFQRENDGFTEDIIMGNWILSIIPTDR